MKRLFTLAVALGAFVALNAQSFEVRYNGQPVKDGDVVTFTPEKVGSRYEIETGTALSVYNLTDEDLGGTCHVEIVENSAASEKFQICMGGTCSAFSTVVYDKDFMVSPESAAGTQLGFRMKQYGTTTVNLTFSILDQEFTVTVKAVHADPAGIESAGTDSQTRSCDAYDATGRLVRRNVQGAGALPRGLYLLRSRGGECRKVFVR